MMVATPSWAYRTVRWWITGATAVIAATLVDPDVVGVRCAAVVPGLVGHHHQIPIASVVVQNGIREEAGQIRTEPRSRNRCCKSRLAKRHHLRDLVHSKMREITGHLCHVGQPIFTERKHLIAGAARTPRVSVIPQPQVGHGKPSASVSIEDFTHRQHQQFNVSSRRAGISTKQAKELLIGIDGQLHFEARRYPSWPKPLQGFVAGLCC